MNWVSGRIPIRTLHADGKVLMQAFKSTILESAAFPKHPTFCFTSSPAHSGSSLLSPTYSNETHGQHAIRPNAELSEMRD